MSTEKLKHTPGPWQLKGLNPPRIYADEGKEIIAQCDSGGEMTQGQEKANARLIASAPELLEALEMLNNEFKRLPQSLGYKYTHTGKVDLIIAKAKGEA